MSERPPISLVDWWMTKSAEERQTFLNDPTITAAVRENSKAVEAYCRANSYRTFVESAVPVTQRQLGCHVFPSKDETVAVAEDDEDEDDAEKAEGGVLTTTAAKRGNKSHEVVLPGGATLSLGSMALLAPYSPLSGVGNRARGRDHARSVLGDKRRADGDAAARVRASAQSRLAHFLADAKAVPSEAGGRQVADLFICLLQEAATAAAYRVGVPEIIERKAEREHSRLVQRQKRVLVLSNAESSGANSGTAAAAAPNPPQTIARPFGARTNDLQGFFGMYSLMQPLLARGSSASGAGLSPKDCRKRQRQPTSEAADVATGHNAARAWTELRHELSEISLPGDAGDGVGQAKAPAVIITEQDLLFALHHMRQTASLACRP